MTASRLVSLVFLLCGLIVYINGYALEELRAKRQAETPTDQECMKPPMKRLAHQCCRLPRERIWGDLRGSLNTCIRKLKKTRRAGEEAMAYDDTAAPEGSDTSTPAGPPRPRTHLRPHHDRNHHQHHHPHHHHPEDSCFMECVFEDQGFILGNMVNKAALLERLNTTLGGNEIWHNVAVTALESCHENEMDVPADSPCRSGSEEIFRCVFKHIFFNCPNWPEKNEYCSAIREFYQKCPNGPPPEVNDDHPTVAPEEEENNPSTEPETNTQES